MLHTNAETSVSSTMPSPTQKQTTGVITGSVAYPASIIPVQKICAVNTKNSVEVCTDYASGKTNNSVDYSIIVVPGDYYVYASLKTQQGDFKTTYKAYYNKFVTCGLTFNCASGLHSQNVLVSVGPGVTSGGVSPTDWYALGITQ
jgi:hypothetical protein